MDWFSVVVCVRDILSNTDIPDDAAKATNDDAAGRPAAGWATNATNAKNATATATKAASATSTASSTSSATASAANATSASKIGR